MCDPEMEALPDAAWTHTQQHTVRVTCHVHASLSSNEVSAPRAGSQDSPQWHIDYSELKSPGNQQMREEPSDPPSCPPKAGNQSP